MGKYSFIDDLVSKGAKTAKGIATGSGASANNKAKMIKNCVNSVQSNLGSGQAKAISELGTNSNRALKEGIDSSVKQIKERTAQKALNKTVSQNGTPVQVSRDFINNKTANRAINVNATGNPAVDTALNNVRSKRVNQVIDGHNARQRDVEMQTLVNNVKDQNINRVPKDRNATRQAVNKGIENVNASKTAKDNWINNNGPQMPIVNGGNYNTGPQASRIIQDGPSHPKPTMANLEGPKKDFKEVNRAPELPPLEADFKIFNQYSSTPNTNNASLNLDTDFINKAKGYAKEAFGGVADTYYNLKDGQDLFTALGNAHKNADGSMNMLRAGGTFVAASAAARVASGGGLYKDRYGNPNLIGVPFI